MSFKERKGKRNIQTQYQQTTDIGKKFGLNLKEGKKKKKTNLTRRTKMKRWKILLKQFKESSIIRICMKLTMTLRWCTTSCRITSAQTCQILRLCHLWGTFTESTKSPSTRVTLFSRCSNLTQAMSKMTTTWTWLNKACRNRQSPRTRLGTHSKSFRIIPNFKLGNLQKSGPKKKLKRRLNISKRFKRMWQGLTLSVSSLNVKLSGKNPIVQNAPNFITRCTQWSSWRKISLLTRRFKITGFINISKRRLRSSSSKCANPRTCPQERTIILTTWTELLVTQTGTKMKKFCLFSCLLAMAQLIKGAKLSLSTNLTNKNSFMS